MQKKAREGIHVLLYVAFLSICCCGYSNTFAKEEKNPSSTVPTNTYDCPADPAWFSTPSLPTEVKKSGSDGSSTFCDFYQFSWQTMAYLMAQSKTNPAVRNFQDTSQYYELEVNNDGTPANSCDTKHDSHTFFVRNTKTKEAGSPFVIPERIGQAGGGATIYDQNGNVVYYDVRFGKSMCDINDIKLKQNFPGGTVELKIAWKVLTSNDDASKYITINAQIGSPKTKLTLGMIGFHIAVATPDHPEFVWSTFEHKVNSPDCIAPSTTTGWSFASEKCTNALQNKDVLGIVQCRFNHPSLQTSLTGTPTEICREYEYGSAPGDLKYDENTGDIESINANVQQYLTGSYAVLTNYFIVGAIWVSHTTQSSVLSNQRGSLRLANTVAETDYQAVDLSPKANFVSNCFGCHGYVGTDKPSAGKNTTSGGLSHIFDDIAVGSKQCLDVQAKNVINSQQEAETSCPSTCTKASSLLKWNGQWTNQDAKTGQQLPMTVCGCCGK
ncbi:MAG: mannan-binding lectin [Gammaproteobacteria bacterium]